jgi:hypothetical protein
MCRTEPRKGPKGGEGAESFWAEASEMYFFPDTNHAVFGGHGFNYAMRYLSSEVLQGMT